MNVNGLLLNYNAVLRTKEKLITINKIKAN